MPSRSLPAFALITGMALVTVACGSQAASPSAGGAAPSTGNASPTAIASPTATTSPTAAGSGGPAATGTCGGTAKPAPPGGTLTLGNRDNVGTFCLRVGQHVLVYLHGSPAHRWAPIHSDSGALQPSPNGRLMLMRGVTGAAFAAVQPGTAHITSARPVCTGTPVRCDAMIAFQVTIVIAAPAN